MWLKCKTDKPDLITDFKPELTPRKICIILFSFWSLFIYFLYTYTIFNRWYKKKNILIFDSIKNLLIKVNLKAVQIGW